MSDWLRKGRLIKQINLPRIMRDRTLIVRERHSNHGKEDNKKVGLGVLE